MKRTILTTLLLASSLAFGQKFQDVSQKGSPVSLSIGFYPSDPDPYVFAQNNSSKGVLVIVAAASFKDQAGQDYPVRTEQDYAFKFGVLKSHDQRGVAPVSMPNIKTISSEPGSIVQQLDDHPDPVKIKQAVGDGAVLFVQFDDGTTWGDSTSGKDLLAARPQKFAFLKHLVETYYESGQDAFDTVLRDGMRRFPEKAVAYCLVGDAESEKMPPIELAKKRLAAAQEWRALGIF
jgi:hypothetical protein